MDLVKNLCANFCSYYKPAKKEELACRGFIVVKRLIEMGKHIPFENVRQKPGRPDGRGPRKKPLPGLSFL